MRSLRVAASWQQGVPAPGQAPDAGAWRFLAKCADYDPDLFFPVGSSGPALRQAARAKAVCAQCPVRVECLEWAQATEQTHGVWGGLDEVEREGLRNRSLRAVVNDGPLRSADGQDDAQHDEDHDFPVARPA